MHADDDKMIEIFSKIAVSAPKCCNRTCYRNWHERKIKDKTRFLEPGPCPFQPPDSAREFRPQSASQSSGQESSQSPASRAASPEPQRAGSSKQDMQVDEAPPKARPVKRQANNMLLVEVKQEETTTWKAATGDAFRDSLVCDVKIEERVGKTQEALYIQRAINKDKRSVEDTMLSTFRATTTQSVGGGWPNVFEPPSPDWNPTSTTKILYHLSGMLALDMAQTTVSTAPSWITPRWN